MLFEKSENWYENEDFWKIYRPLMFDPDRLADSGFEAEGIIQLADIKPGMKILDTCCGEARHCIEFAKRGFDVTGVDITTSYLKTAKENILKNKLRVNLVKEDIRRFKGDSSYDFALNFFTSFGYFEEMEDDLLFCRNVCSSLKKGGKFLIDTIGKETAAMNFKGREWFNRDGYNIMLEYKISDCWTHLINRWLFICDDASKQSELFEISFKHRLYSAVEMADLLNDAGFSEIRFFGNLDGRAYDHKANRMIAIAVK